MFDYKSTWNNWLRERRLHLSRSDALLQLSILGGLTGLISGSIIIIFRFLVGGIQHFILPEQLGVIHEDNFEGLSRGWHFFFPVIAGCLLAGLYYRYSQGLRVLGIARVIERMSYNQGYLTVRGFFIQFIGASIAIIGGHSVGREGPHVYLGAAAGSLFGQFFKLPNNCIRLMLACGVASGIAASFNTPLAGVIFSLEVILMEYTLSSLMPVILSAGVATALSNHFFGSSPAFSIPDLMMSSLNEIPIILLLGVVVGVASAIMTFSIRTIVVKTSKIEVWWKLIAAGVITGSIALFQPEILGIGYDTVTVILKEGHFTISILLSLMIMKMLATIFCIGLSVPGGIIAPSFFIGATIGSLMGAIITHYSGATESMIGFYALLGMGAMVGAILQAPLTALTAILELTYSPSIIMPGILTIIVAQLTAHQLFNQPSLFISLLRSNGLDIKANPISQALRREGVASAMNKAILVINSMITRNVSYDLLGAGKKWLVIKENDRVVALMHIAELARYLRNFPDVQQINLLDIPAERRELLPIDLQSTLQQAYEKMNKGAESLYVILENETIVQNQVIYGVLTPRMVDLAYRY